jgi:hypothetical protein
MHSIIDDDDDYDGGGDDDDDNNNNNNVLKRNLLCKDLHRPSSALCRFLRNVSSFTRRLRLHKPGCSL